MSKIQDAVYAYIGGTVADVRHGKTGLYLWVEVQREGAQYPDRVTIWGLNNTSFSKGDRVKAKGWLSWQRSQADDGKVYFNVSMNKPEIIEHEKALQAAQVAADILGATPLDDEAPF